MALYATTLKKGVKWYRKLAKELLLGMAGMNLGGVVPVLPGGFPWSHHLVVRTGNNGKRMQRICKSCYAQKQKKGARTAQER